MRAPIECASAQNLDIKRSYLKEYMILVQNGQKIHYDHDAGGGCGWLWWWWWWCMKSWVINRYKIAENESQTPLAAAPPVINRCCAQLVKARLCAGCSLLLSSTRNYRVSLKKGTFLIFCLISVLEVGFCFFTCVSESEFQARFI